MAAHLPLAVASPTVLYVAGLDTSESVASLQSRLDQVAPGVRITSRHQLLSELNADPFTAFADRGLRLLTWFSLLLAGVAVVAALVISASARRRRLNLLMSLGLRSSQRWALTLVEQLVPMTLAVCLGLAVAVGLARLLIPVLDLGSFTGGRVAVPVGAMTRSLLVPTVAAGALVALTTAVAGLTERVKRGDTILSTGDEE